MLACHATATLSRRGDAVWTQGLGSETFKESTLTRDTAAFYRGVQHSCCSQTWYTLLYPDLSYVTAPPPLSSQVHLMSFFKYVFVLFGQRGLSSLVCCLHCVLFRELLLCAVPPLLWGGGCARAFLLEGQGANLRVFLGFRYS